MRTQLALALFTLLAAGCASTQAGPPDEVATEILTAIDQSQPDEADELFDAVEGRGEYRERIYPKLFGTAEQRFERGEGAGATRVLRFLARHYPDATAVREALLYSLFLERGARDGASPAQTEELAEVLEEVRSSGASTPVWVDLVETQLRIDQGELALARASFDRFLEGWSGEPEALLVYVEDVARYLSTH